METTVLMCVKAVCKNREHHTKTSPRTISYISLSTSFCVRCFWGVLFLFCFVCCFAAETMRAEMIAEVVGSDSAAQNHEILTWCQFYAAHHGSGSGKWLSLARGKTWKTNHTESTLSSRPYTARYRAFQCAWLSRMRLYSAGNGIHIFLGGEEGDVIFFIFF